MTQRPIEQHFGEERLGIAAGERVLLTLMLAFCVSVLLLVVVASVLEV